MADIGKKIRRIRIEPEPVAPRPEPKPEPRREPAKEPVREPARQR